MAINKTEYRKNRENGKRGQGELPKPIIKEGKRPSHMIQIGSKMEMVSRKIVRMYAAGTKKLKPKAPVYRAGETNHERVRRQRFESGRLKDTRS